MRGDGKRKPHEKMKRRATFMSRLNAPAGAANALPEAIFLDGEIEPDILSIMLMTTL
jgi:hypothetical protein